LRAVAQVRAGNREHQVDEHAAIQGQLADRGGFNDFSDARIDGVEQVGRGRVDLDNRGRRSQLKRQIEFQLLGDFNANGMGELGEPRGRNGKIIVARQNPRDLKDASELVATRRSACVSLEASTTAAAATGLRCGSLTVPLTVA